MDKTISLKSRVVRVFISSTFRDMQAERDELAKVVFPELKVFCRERGVEFVEVDLRWGVTEEQAQRGETLRLCLEEIQRCRPYFIGLLGERYGWVPAQLSQDDREDYPWLEQHRGSSVTELEIMHGVLNDPAMATRSHFYFRSPAYALARGADYASESPQATEKLRALKERIRHSGLPLVTEYPDPQTVAKQIGEHLRATIELEYPVDGGPTDLLEREAEDHEAFAVRRERVYIDRQDYYQRLDSFVEANIAPDATSAALLVTGESGSGKSALLANWARRRRESHPDDFLLLHFIGSTPASTDYEALLRRLMSELKRRFGLKDDLPGETKALVRAFPNWLSNAAVAAKVNKLILVLDGLNQLEGRDAAPELGWLPVIFPANMRVIVSTLSGNSLEAMGRRPHAELRVEPLAESERAELIEEYLAQYRKQLTQECLERIAAAPACANPLYLRLLLEELRLFGLHEKLPERIEHYLQAETVEELFQKVLERLETDYDPVRRGVWNPPENLKKGMVGEALSLIWAARRGLTESELLDLLGNPPRAAWSPLYLALEEALVERRGVLNFFHDYLCQAVESRYLEEVEVQKAARRKLGEFFFRRLDAERAALDGMLNLRALDKLLLQKVHITIPLTSLSPRALDELPWLWRMAQEWQKLFDLLADVEVFNALWQHDQYELKTGWAAIEAESNLNKMLAYQNVISSPEKYNMEVVWNLSILLAETGNLPEALRLQSPLADSYLQSGDVINHRAAISDHALTLYSSGDMGGALVLHKEAERISRESNDFNGLQLSLGNQAAILYARGDLDGAMALVTEKESICRQLGYLDDLGAALGYKALILKTHGKLDEAIALHKEEERLFRQVGNLDGLSTSLGNQSIILSTRGDLDGAMALAEESECICRQLGNQDGLQESLGIQALILRSRGRLDEAMALHKEEEHICRLMGNLHGLQASLANQANILYARGDLDRSMALSEESEYICSKLGDLNVLSQLLGNRALILKDRGELEKAMVLMKEQERISRQLGNMEVLSASLGNQGLVLYVRGDLVGALTLYKEQERLCRQLGNLDGLQISLGNQGLILKDHGDLDGAMALFKEQERICRQLGNLNRLQNSLGKQASILKSRGKLDEAMAFYKEEEQICRQIGKLDELQASLANQANILSIRADIDGAMALFKEQERLCSQIGNRYGLAYSLASQAFFLSQQGNKATGLSMAQQALELAERYGYTDLVGGIKNIIRQFSS